MLDLGFVAEADEEGAAGGVAEQDGAAERAVKFLGRDSGGEGAALDEEGDEIGVTGGGGADVDF